MRTLFTNEKHRNRYSFSIQESRNYPPLFCNQICEYFGNKIPTHRNEKSSNASKIRAFEIGTAYADFRFVARNKKILVVEDNSDLRKLLVKILTHFGYETLEASSGTEAINQASAAHPEVILMDIYLPEMTGDEITACLKANPATRDIPVVFTSAFLVEVLKDRAPFTGAAEILHKPFSLTILRELLDRHLSTDESKETCCG